MDENDLDRRSSRSLTPLLFLFIALLLLGSYVGSYFLLVTPPGSPSLIGVANRYRIGEPFTPILFFPLEQIDRRVRPKAWILPRKE